MITLEDKNFGIEVKKKLLDIGMKQIEIAQEIGISEGFLSEVLSGKKEAFDTRKKIINIIQKRIENAES